MQPSEQQKGGQQSLLLGSSSERKHQQAGMLAGEAGQALCTQAEMVAASKMYIIALRGRSGLRLITLSTRAATRATREPAVPAARQRV